MIFQLGGSDWPWLAVSILAAWRLTCLLSYEKGPFASLERLRGLLAALGLGAVAACFHCLGFWTSAAVVLTVFRPCPVSALLVFAVAGGVSLIERFLLARAVPEEIVEGDSDVLRLPVTGSRPAEADSPPAG